MKPYAALTIVTCSLALGAAPEDRALAYLAAEVPGWPANNGCFSCHNNGDAARALFTARRLGLAVPAAALRETIAWLGKPSQWDQNRGDPRFSDKKLARLQFAAALADAVRARLIDRALLREAAIAIAGLQQSDGSWIVEGEEPLGSPVTWGSSLATAMACEILRENGGYKREVGGAESWLMRLNIASVPDAAAVILGNPSAVAKVREAVDYIRRAQTSEGGFGPQINRPPEAFDTALALIALSRLTGDPGAAELIARNRPWLIRAQLDSGGWTETTRPPGNRSYAQHISTSGWATLALLLTRLAE